MDLATGLIIFKRERLNDSEEGEVRISESSLFHSIIVEGKRVTKETVSNFEQRDIVFLPCLIYISS